MFTVTQFLVPLCGTATEKPEAPLRWGASARAAISKSEIAARLEFAEPALVPKDPAVGAAGLDPATFAL